MERFPITATGKLKLEEEIRRLKTVERPRIIKAIEEARAHGDLSENAEYHAAKEQQGQSEARLRDLEDKLARAEVIPLPTTKPDRVIFGAKVVLVDSSNEKEISYRIVSEYEADPGNNIISVTSPIARGLVGKQIGDEVTIRTPGGVRTFEVIDILV